METKRKKFTESIQELCARMNLFEGGDGDAYQKLIKACKDPYFSSRDIAMMIYACSDAGIDDIIRAVEEARCSSVDRGSRKMIPSKAYAAIHDIFQEEIMLGCRDIAEAISPDAYGRDSIEEIYYENCYHEKFEMLAADLIRDAYGFTFEPDGTSF